MKVRYAPVTILSDLIDELWEEILSEGDPQNIYNAP